VLDDAPPIVSAAAGAQRADVRLDADGSAWLCHWTVSAPARIAGTQLSQDTHAAMIQGGDWEAVGGVAPREAAVVQVRGQDGVWRDAALSDSAWVIIQPSVVFAPALPPIRLAGRDGGMVPQAHPPGAPAFGFAASDWPGLPVRGSADGRCPACGHARWNAWPSRQGTGRFVACARCGHSDGAQHALIG
jgi:hypothetical protein